MLNSMTALLRRPSCAGLFPKSNSIFTGDGRQLLVDLTSSDRGMLGPMRRFIALVCTGVVL